MPFVKIDYVMKELTVSRSTIYNMIDQGMLEKHTLPSPSRGSKRRPVRFDRDAIDRLKARILSGEFEGPFKPASTTGAVKRPSAGRRRRRVKLAGVRNYE